MSLLRGTALFPLLRKDLTEMAQRRRTYVLRVAAALLLFGLFMLFFGASLSSSRRYAGSALGSGGDVFDFVTVALFVGIYVMLPATMSGALTYEKERHMMALLLLTDLRPSEILLEKYVGRLFSMFVFLLLALPLLAVAYAYGGVPTGRIEATVYVLILTCLQVGALALMNSAFFTNGSSAFIATYILCGFFYFGSALLLTLLQQSGVINQVDDDVAFALFPVYILDNASGPGMAKLAVRSIPILFSTGCLLLMARRFIVRRAFATPGHALRRFFQRLDRFWQKANWLTGGIVLIHEADTLPDRLPVTWREVRTRSLARFSYLFRILCAVEVPVLLVVAACVTDVSFLRSDCMALSVTLFILWPIAVLALAVVAGNTFPSERVRQTMDLLLTTPMSGAEIVRQKVRALRRLALVLAAPLMTVYVAEALVENRPWSAAMWSYLVVSLLAVAVYFPLFTWMSVWIGLRVRSRAAGTIVPVAVIALWCALPLVLIAALIDAFNWPSRLPYTATMLSSPASMMALPEFSDTLKDAFGRAWPVLVGANYLLYGAVALLFRRLCMGNADRYLGRVPAPGLHFPEAAPGEEGLHAVE